MNCSHWIQRNILKHYTRQYFLGANHLHSTSQLINTSSHIPSCDPFLILEILSLKEPRPLQFSVYLKYCVNPLPFPFFWFMCPNVMEDSEYLVPEEVLNLSAVSQAHFAIPRHDTVNLRTTPMTVNSSSRMKTVIITFIKYFLCVPGTVQGLLRWMFSHDKSMLQIVLFLFVL